MAQDRGRLLPQQHTHQLRRGADGGGESGAEEGPHGSEHQVPRQALHGEIPRQNHQLRWVV